MLRLVVSAFFVLALATGQEDPGVLLRANDSPTVREANTTLSVCVDVFGSVPESAAARVITRDGTAKANKDYVPLELAIALSNERSTKCFNISILDDDIVEVSETFSVELVDIVGRFRVLQSSAAITITPNVENVDTITVVLERSSYTAGEDSGSVEVCVVLIAGGVDDEKPFALPVDLSLLSDSAESGLDFVNTSPEFLFEPGSMVGTTLCISIFLFDDIIIENDEKFTVQLQESETVSVDKEREESVIVIKDNEGAMLFLSPTGTQLLQEANPGDLADSTSVCVSLEATYPLARSVSLTLELGGGSADPDKDFVVGPSTTIELTELGSRQCINISIVNDDLRERNETFIVTPVPLDSDDVVVGGPFTAVILDDGDVNCPELSDPANGRVLLTDRIEGSTAVYECESSYTLSGNNSRVCGSDGQWDGEPAECLLDCGQPPAVANGDPVFTGTTAGSLTRYSCHGERVQSGEVVLECLENGEWSGAPPPCLAMCGNLSNPTNGEVQLNSTVEGSRAVYSCTEGYRLHGPEERVCGADSLWSDSEPLCLPDDSVLCPGLQDPANGLVQTNGVTASYSCENSLVLLGESERRCDTVSGEWLGEAPVCSGEKLMTSFALVTLTLILTLKQFLQPV